MKINNPYSLRTNLPGTISLKAKQTNAQYLEHLLENLKKYLEGTVVNNIYIVKVNEITNIDSNEVSRKNIIGSVDFKIKYSAYACIPKKGDHILMKIENLSAGVIKTKNGPIIGNLVPTVKFIDQSKFSIDNTSAIQYKDGNILKIDDIILIEIITLTFKDQGQNIYLICKLLDMASEDEIKMFDKQNNFIFDEKEDEPYI